MTFNFTPRVLKHDNVLNLLYRFLMHLTPGGGGGGGGVEGEVLS